MEDLKQDIILTLNDHRHEIDSLKHRVDKCEGLQEAIMGITMSVNKLAGNMEIMIAEQKDLKQEVTSLKEAPSEDFKYYKRLIIGCILTTLLGAIVGAFATIIIKGGI